MNKLAIAAVAASAIISTSAFAGGASSASPKTGWNSPTLDGKASCVGAERASRNSMGGDRDQGGFGPAQADYVQSLDVGYGQWLRDSGYASRDTCPSPGYGE